MIFGDKIAAKAIADANALKKNILLKDFDSCDFKEFSKKSLIDYYL
ncbi:MAG: hypothetical protein R2784_00420 [Saprospiraceae bacterium]